MYEKSKMLKVFCMVIAVLFCISGCGSTTETNPAPEETKSSQENAEDNQAAGAAVPAGEQEESRKETAAPEQTAQESQIVETDLKPSDGLAFESNGDGTCTIVGIGVCTDKDLVIPNQSPDGDTVTLIGERAFYSLEDVDSVTLINADYEVDEGAFQYSELTAVNVIGGSPMIKKSAFSGCEDLTAVSFGDCNIQTGEYAFYNCGKDAEVVFSNCTGTIEEYSFQYSSLSGLVIDNCELMIEKSAFSGCEDLKAITFTDSVLETEEYAFYSCGDAAKVEMTNCSLTFDDYTFQYSSLESLAITGSKAGFGKSAFSGCEDLTAVTIDCDSVALGEYAFYSCEDLASVAICENAGADCEIEIDDNAFQYCENLETVSVGGGSPVIGKRVFSGCADNLTIMAAGKHYIAETIEDGLK